MVFDGTPPVGSEAEKNSLAGARQGTKAYE